MTEKNKTMVALKRKQIKDPETYVDTRSKAKTGKDPVNLEDHMH